MQIILNPYKIQYVNINDCEVMYESGMSCIRLLKNLNGCCKRIDVVPNEKIPVCVILYNHAMLATKEFPDPKQVMFTLILPYDEACKKLGLRVKARKHNFIEIEDKAKRLVSEHVTFDNITKAYSRGREDGETYLINKFKTLLKLN